MGIFGYKCIVFFQIITQSGKKSEINLKNDFCITENFTSHRIGCLWLVKS